MWLSIILVIVILALVAMASRPRLDPTPPPVRAPESDDLRTLAGWLSRQEQQVDNLIEGAEAVIHWADPNEPARAPVCFVYVHGFSATRQETAPVTDRIAAHFGGNILYLRIAGHGIGPEGMLTRAEDWLQSMVDGWSIACRLGERVVLVATSTGAPLSIWLMCQKFPLDRLHAVLFMSPNFRIRSRFDFLLTWPGSKYWLRFILGDTHRWEAINEEHARYWSNHYSTRALIEMQKMVNWTNRQDLAELRVPLALMYMKNDPVIDPKAAETAFEAWGAQRKLLIPVTVDPDSADHVFAGRITAPHRVDWCVDQFIRFLEDIGTPGR